MSIQGRSNLKSKTGLRSIQSAVGGRPMSGLVDETVAQVVAEDTEQITALQAQLASLQAQLAAAQAALAQAQAQIVADAATIASLQAQVLSLQGQVATLQGQVAVLQAQIAALSSPLYGRFIFASVVEVGGGIYVPPTYDDPIISVTKVHTKEIIKSITTTGGGYP
jgi:polyhydroxyalkanoate synthesis regulator phasin